MSKMQIEGVVEEYYVKPTKNGSYRHAVKIQGSVYSAFADDDKPRANLGDTVTFPAEQKGEYFNIAGQVKVTKRSKGHQQSAQQKYASNEDTRQGQIIRQSSMGYASTLVSALINSGAYEDYSEDDFAKTVIRLADEYFYPYAKDGTKPE